MLEVAQWVDRKAAMHHAVGNKFIGFCFFQGAVWVPGWSHDGVKW